MPAAVSKKQYRYMMAILHGKGGMSSRGDRVPKSVAGKYAGKDPGGDAPESKGKEHEGGKWDEKGHEKAKKQIEESRKEKKKKKSELRKALEDFLISRGHKAAGCLVVDSEGRVLLGKRGDSGQWATPGGHVEDTEDFKEAALRELREEANLVGKDAEEIHYGNYRGYESKTYLVNSFKGKLKTNGELSNLKFFEPHEIPWKELTDYSFDCLTKFISQKLQKTKELKFLLAEEELKKNIMRSGNAPGDVIYELTHGDALRIVGNGTFRMLREATKDMGDEDFRDVKIDQYTLHIRKHTNDVYSGRVVDGHKQVHQFANKSLPSVAAELMSVFEWYMPEDEKELEIMDDSALPDDVIEGGMNALIDKYKKHNIVNIYNEMENIREEIRHGTAVDLQQVEQRIMKLFDRLEQNILEIKDKHNSLNTEAGDAIDVLERKLIELQSKVDELNKQPVTVSAYASTPVNDRKVHDEFYPYLSRPSVMISPDGHIKISFSADWTPMERENFLRDMRAKVIKKMPPADGGN